MVSADPRWLAILKASGWQTGALGIALGIVYLLIVRGILPNPGAPWTVAIAAAAIICAALCLATIASALARLIGKAFHEWQEGRARTKFVRDYIPHMTPKEREIVGWLLAKNQKMLQSSLDGGYAQTLISRGIIVQAVLQGQRVDVFDVPFAVPDYVWKVLTAHADQFPSPAPDAVTPPWRKPMI